MAANDIFAVDGSFYSSAGQYANRPPRASTPVPLNPLSKSRSLDRYTKGLTSTANTTARAKSGETSESQYRTGAKEYNVRTIDPNARRALEKLLNSITLSDNAQSVINQGDTAKLQALAQLTGTLGINDPIAAMQRAEGQVADLQRQLTEQALPEVFGAAETARTSSNALSQLLANDLTARTAEAQSRVMQDAYNAAVEQNNNIAEVIDTLAGSGPAGMGALLEAIGLGKDTGRIGFEATTESTAGRTAESVQEVTNALTEKLYNPTAVEEELARTAPLMALASALPPYMDLGYALSGSVFDKDKAAALRRAFGI